MDVNLDEMTEEINERIAKLESKKIRIRERLKAIETKSEALTSRWEEQLEAIKAVKLVATDLENRKGGSRTSPVEVSQDAEISRVNEDPDLKEFPQSLNVQSGTRALQEAYGSDSLGSLKEQLLDAAERSAADPLPSLDEDEDVDLRIFASAEAGSILVVDDEEAVRTVLAEVLELEGYRVDLARNGAEGLAKLSEQPYGVTFLDLRMPGESGIDILKTIKTTSPQMPVIVVSGIAHGHELEAARRQGAFACVKKPWDTAELLRLIRTAISSSNQKITES